MIEVWKLKKAKELSVAAQIGQLVNITLNDGQIIMGLLNYFPETQDRHGWKRPGYYYVGDVHFTANEVKTLELI